MRRAAAAAAAVALAFDYVRICGSRWTVALAALSFTTPMTIMWAWPRCETLASTTSVSMMVRRHEILTQTLLNPLMFFHSLQTSFHRLLPICMHLQATRVTCRAPIPAMICRQLPRRHGAGQRCVRIVWCSQRRPK